MTALSPPRDKLANLQILRFVAAAMVLLSHLHHEIISQSFIDLTTFVSFDILFWTGGVDIFFIISGFIMYYTSAAQFGQPGGMQSFLLRRLLRIVPPYWFFTTLMLGAILLLGRYIDHAALDPLHILASYLFIPAHSPTGQFLPVLMVGWTLNYEMLFYLIFAVALLLPLRWGVAAVTLSLTGLAVASLRAGLSGPLAFWASPLLLNFLLGMALAFWRQRSAGWSYITGWVIVASGFGVMIVMQQLGFVSFDKVGSRILWMGLPAFVICAGLALANEPQQNGRLRRFCILGGDASYALYLSHPFSINAVALLFKLLHLSNPWLYLATGLSSAIAAAIIYFLLIERPVYRWLKRKLLK